MARIANVSLDELGQAIFSASGGGTRPQRSCFFTDYKEFHIAGHDLAVSQITCVDSRPDAGAQGRVPGSSCASRQEKQASTW